MMSSAGGGSSSSQLIVCRNIGHVCVHHCICKRQSSKNIMASKTEQLSSENEPLVGLYRTSSPRWFSRRRCCFVSVVAVVLLAAAALAIGLGVGLGASGSSALYKSVKTANLLTHLEELENIAGENEQSRAVHYGYNESANYVMNKLTDAGYSNVSKQEFMIGIFDLVEGNLSATFNDITLNFTLGSQFSVMRYSGSTGGFLQSSIVPVNESGCDEADYTFDTIALINYNANVTSAGCTIYEMVSSAKSAGVSALLMMRTEDDPNKAFPPNARLYNQTFDDFQISDLPVLGVNYQMGQTLRDIHEQYSDLSLTVNVNASTNFWTTHNILAYTLDGATDSIIAVGSHLDSVPAGPGINDNGSGSMANLEIAIQLAKSGKKPVNQVLFAFWGAEELGLLGSQHFVKRLTEDGTISDIALNLNYDMIASPNYVRQVYNGSGAENYKVVRGSAKIQGLFEEFFKSEGLNFRLKEFNGRSDYGPFIEEGVDIPAGGLATGADEIKTAEERTTYGGLANAILDPCYHQACDTLDNIDQAVYEEMSQGAAYVLEELMMMEDLQEFLNN